MDYQSFLSESMRAVQSISTKAPLGSPFVAYVVLAGGSFGKSAGRHGCETTQWSRERLGKVVSSSSSCLHREYTSLTCAKWFMSVSKMVHLTTLQKEEPPAFNTAPIFFITCSVWLTMSGPENCMVCVCDLLEEEGKLLLTSALSLQKTTDTTTTTCTWHTHTE